MSRESLASAFAPLAGARGSATTRWLWIACASYVLLRWAILYTAFDQTALWAYELYMCGTVARSMLGGGGDLPLPYFYDNAAGPVLMGLVVAPCYAAFGSSYLVLKLVPMALGLGVLVLSWHLLRRLFDARAANLAALLIAFAPTTLTKYTLIGAGNHSENLFFTLLATWSFFEMHARGVTSKRLAATGLFAGWAFAIFIGALTPLGLLAIAHFGLRGWRAAVRELAPTLAGFALGFAPVVWLNLGSGGRGLAFLAAKFGEEGAKREPFLPRLLTFFTEHLPAASTFPSFLGIPGRAADWLFFAVTIAALLACAPLALRAPRDFVLRQREPASDASASLRRAFVFCVWAYLPLTAIAYATSNLKIGGYAPPVVAGGYRYFLPHFVYAILLIAVAVSGWSLSRAPWLRRGALALSAAPLVAGAFNVALIDFTFARPNVGAHYEGHNFAQTARTLLSPALKLSPEQVVAHVERFTPPLRARVYFGAGYYKAVDAKGFVKGQSFELAPLLASFPTERRADVARGIGAALHHRHSVFRDLRTGDCERVDGWLKAGQPFAEQVAEGLCFDWFMVTSTGTREFLERGRELYDQAPATLRPALARGMGHAYGRLLRREIEVDRATIFSALERALSEHRALALAGVGAGLADGAERPRVDAFAVADWRDADVESVLAGFSARLREIWGAAPPDADDLIDPALPNAWHEHWERLLAQ